MFWGITPALNLFQELGRIEDKTINVLLIGGADARHILKTLAKKYQHEDVTINFYVIELAPEVIAKELLLLNIALQPVAKVGLLSKTRMFLDIYGNTLNRPVSAKFLLQRAGCLLEMITNVDCMMANMSMITMDIKYKERDYIENICKFWMGEDPFDILQYWDKRMRKQLGVRYDTRHGAFDWDLHMKLHNVGAKLVCNQEYQSFRRNGVAFCWLESVATKPNRSMVTGLIANGEHFGHYGYLGDMEIGPFISYGIECEDEEYTQKANNVYRYRATDITERNLCEIFHEIEFACEYHHTKLNDITLGSTVMRIPDASVVDVNNYKKHICKMEQSPCFDLKGVTINFVSISKLHNMKHKPDFNNFFNIIYYAHNCTKHIDHELINNLLKKEAVLIIEHPLFVISYRDKELEEYFQSMKKKLEHMEAYRLDFDKNKDYYIKYNVQ